MSTIWLLIVINVLIYMDRGMLAGVENQIIEFIGDTVPGNSTSSYYGLLQSVYTVAFTVGSMAFGYWGSSYPKFFLVAGGIFLWAVSNLLVGVMQSYWAIFWMRGIAGLGEASFQCLMAPVIMLIAPAGSRALVIALFYAAIPLGTALGYVVGSAVAGNEAWSIAGVTGFRLAFAGQVVFLVPLFLLMLVMPSEKDLLSMARRESGEDGAEGVDEAAEEAAAEDARKAEEAAIPSEMKGLRGVVSMLKNPTFTAAVLGNAALMFMTSSYGLFGPTYLVPLNLLKADKKEAAPMYFGVLVALAGLIGTVAGGAILDVLVKCKLARKVAGQQGERQALLAPAPATHGAGAAAGSAAAAAAMGHVERSLVDGHVEDVDLSDDEAEAEALQAAPVEVAKQGYVRLSSALQLLVVAAVLSTVLMFASLLSVAGSPWCEDPAGNCPPPPSALLNFFLALAPGSLVLFINVGVVNFAVMSSVPTYARPMALGVGQVLQHGFGDVPGPIIVGAVADSLRANPTDELSPENAASVRGTLVFMYGWLAWCVLCWAIAYWDMWSKHKRGLLPWGDPEVPETTPELQADVVAGDVEAGGGSYQAAAAEGRVDGARGRNWTIEEGDEDAASVASSVVSSPDGL